MTTMRYPLVDRRTGVGETFVGAVRVRKANEGAVRENIRTFGSEVAASLGDV